jgi:hypothetical protein
LAVLPLIAFAAVQVPVWLKSWRSMLTPAPSTVLDPTLVNLWMQGAPAILWALLAVGAWIGLKAALRYRP